MNKKNIKVISESDSGRNKQFFDPNNNRTMSRTEFAERIVNGEYGGYHIRMMNGMRTPASNPDHSERNNLG